MQCMVPGSQTIEERINVLRWIRQHRNVMNRKYLEQILAIFGVTLVDVVKHYPMQCTTPCTTPVNTERLRYKVLLRLQYPMAADMSCIIENYLPGYLRVEWVVDMPWGEWILNSGYELAGDNIRYTAHKTNQRDFYDSYADFDLITALVRSFHNTDMQQWQGFKDAVNEMVGIAVWNVDAANEQIVYTQACQNTGSCPNVQYQYRSSITGTIYNSKEAACDYLTKYPYPGATFSHTNGTNPISCYFTVNGKNYMWNTAELVLNPNYDPTAEQEKKTLPFDVVAQQVISNLLSLDQGISLLAETYIETVAKSIFISDESKQFVRLSDLISRFDLNKTLRT